MRKEQEHYTELFLSLDDASAQCDYLIGLGMAAPESLELRSEELKVAGCKTAIWIRVTQVEGRVHFSFDSDSVLVKGVLTIYKALYNGQQIQTVRAHPPVFLERISEAVIYPEVREHGLKSCYMSIAGLET